MATATQLERAAAWVSGLSITDVPLEVLALARAQRMDILASLAAGARTQVGRAILRALDATGRESTGEQLVTSLPDGRRRPLLDAVYLHATLANALELDDFVFAGHTGQAAVGVPLALGQITGATGEETLLAQVAANEIAGRLGAVMTAGPQHGHMKAYLHRLAATVAAARLLRLDERQIATAMAIALSAPEFPLFHAAWSPDTKALCTGDPIVAGVRAAYLAAAGVGAALDIVEHAVGLVTSLSENSRAPDVWQTLGHTWSLQAICFKPLAACAYAAGAAVAAGRLVEAFGSGWEHGRVKDVEVRTTVLSVTMEGFSRPHEPGLITPSNTNFSTRRTVALTLLTGRPPTGASFTPEAFEPVAAAVGKLGERVRLTHHWPYTIDLLRGVDAAIDHPGRPGIYGMAETHRTMARFRAAFGTPAALGVGDVPALLRLPRADRSYLLRRYAVGLRARLPFASAPARARYVSRETDLARMSLRFAAAVAVQLDDGRTLSEEVRLPPGFAGSDGREAIAEGKLLRELGAATLPAVAQRVCALLSRTVPPSPREIVDSYVAPSVLA
jgi:2-methylcitrate dehydratase PrpD